MIKKRQDAPLRKLVLVGLVILLGVAGMTPARAANTLNFPPQDFTIYSPKTGNAIGTSRYEVLDSHGPRIVIHGENRYHDGEYDVENDVLHVRGGNSAPAMVSFEHAFYNRNGSIKVLGSADVKTGQAVCVVDESGQKRKFTAKLHFPADTYAGAALLVPIQHALAAGSDRTIRMHVFDCGPQPRVVPLEVTTSDQRWQFYPGKLIKANVKPDFGIWNFLIAPFVPKLHAWFDPHEEFGYVGGRIHRYLFGSEQVILAKSKPAKDAAPGGHVLKTDAAIPPASASSSAHNQAAAAKLPPTP